MVLFLVQRWHQHPPSRPSLDVRADAAGLLSRLLATPIPATRAESASRLSPHLRSDSVASHLCGCSALHRSTCPRFATHKKAGLASRSLHQITHLWACNCNSQLPPCRTKSRFLSIKHNAFHNQTPTISPAQCNFCYFTC